MKHKHIVLILSSTIMMLMMGTVYTYSVFRYHIENLYDVSNLESGYPYMASLFFYAFSMMITGRLLRHNRLRLFAVTGTMIIALGFILSAYMNHIYGLIFTYGFMIGTGVGMVYGIPIYMIQKLLSKRSGLTTGIVLMGFGASPLVTAPISSALINGYGLKSTFIILGISFIIIQLPLSLVFLLKEGAIKKVPNDQTKHLKLKPFKRVYGLFLISTTVGLMMIGLSYVIGVNYYGFDGDAVTIAISVFAILNGIARPIFGKLMDLKGFKFSATISVVLITFASLIALLNQGQHILLYLVSFGLYWFNLGAWLAIVPQAIKDYYGIKAYSKTYGLMFTSYGIGAILGTVISGVIMDLLQNTNTIYMMILIFMAIALLIIYYMPKSKENPQ